MDMNITNGEAEYKTVEVLIRTCLLMYLLIRKHLQTILFPNKVFRGKGAGIKSGV